MQRVFEEIAFVRNTLLSPEQVSRVRACWRGTSSKNSQENGYLLNQISRRYSDGDAANVGAAVEPAADRGAERRGDPGGGAEVPRYGELREGDADAGREVARSWSAPGRDVSRHQVA